MKYKILVLMLLVACMCYGQEKTYYCSIFTPYIQSGTVNAYLDFGNGSFYAKNDAEIVDEKGEKMKFKSLVEVINYMADRGWSVVSQNVLPQGRLDVTIGVLTLFSKKTTKDNLKEGITLKGDLKK